MIAVNITAVSRIWRTHSARRMTEPRAGGGLVLFGSIVGWQGVPGQANYAATKAYVQSLAEGLHDELASRAVSTSSPSRPGRSRPGSGAGRV